MRARCFLFLCAFGLPGFHATSQVQYLAAPGDNVLKLQLCNRTSGELDDVHVRFAGDCPPWILPKEEATASLAAYRVDDAASSSVAMFDVPFQVSPSGARDSEVRLEVVQGRQILGVFKVLLTFSNPDGSPIGPLGKAGSAADQGKAPLGEEFPTALPAEYALSQNYPNPFNPATNIQLQLSENGWTVLRVYDLLGREVKSLLNREMPAGLHTVTWDGTNSDGRLVPSGVYIYRMTNPHFNQTRKMVVIR